MLVKVKKLIQGGELVWRMTVSRLLLCVLCFCDRHRVVVAEGLVRIIRRHGGSRQGAEGMEGANFEWIMISNLHMT